MGEGRLWPIVGSAVVVHWKPDSCRCFGMLRVLRLSNTCYRAHAPRQGDYYPMGIVLGAHRGVDVHLRVYSEQQAGPTGAEVEILDRRVEAHRLNLPWTRLYISPRARAVVAGYDQLTFCAAIMRPKGAATQLASILPTVGVANPDVQAVTAEVFRLLGLRM